MANILLAVLILLPAILAFLLKSNAALGFLALCGGFATVTLSGSNIEHLVGQTRITSLTSNNVDLALLAVPLLLTLLLSYKSSGSKNSRYFSVVPALCAGGLLAIVAAPMFSSALQINVTDSQFWLDLKNIESYIVSVGFLSSLILVWSSGFKHGHSKKHK